MTRLSLGLLAALALTACHRDEATLAQAAPAAVPVVHGFGPEISAEDFSEHVKTLASDEFGGRAPGSDGEEKTVQYLKAQFQRLGLQPGNGDSYFQTVPMIETIADPGTTAHVAVNGHDEALAFGTDMVVGTRTAQPEVKVEGSDMVFVGYGVDAPEQDWNDYAGLDLKGKTVVMLINDPGFHNGDASLFEGRRMTYYGRWTYKFEEAARQGATAAIIIHDTAGAAYGWDVVKNSWAGAQFDLTATDDPAPRLPIQSWITGEAAQRLFAEAGLDLAKLRDAAGKRGFQAVPIPAKFSVDLKNTLRQASSRNVIAVLPGSRHPDEAVVYSAHWDHLGTHADESGDNIYNGAVDNGTGVAGVLEIAEQFTVQTPRPERSLIFLIDTLEESGLLGSKYYVAHPTVPMAKTVADINLDALLPVGPTRDFVIVGKGNNELDQLMAPILAAQGRTAVEETGPEKGSYFRSDHFNFAKAGVPALDPDTGIDLVEGGKRAGQALQDDYTAHRYHKAADNYDPNWDLRGVVQDLQALYELGQKLSNGGQWPNYVQGNAFRAVRDASRPPAAR